MKKWLIFLCVMCFMFCSFSPVFAEDNNITTGEITGKTVVAGILSFVIPGIGQAVNEENSEKILTHGVLGFIFPPVRFWSCYDALVDREGGYWKGRI